MDSVGSAAAGAGAVRLQSRCSQPRRCRACDPGEDLVASKRFRPPAKSRLEFTDVSILQPTQCHYQGQGPKEQNGQGSDGDHDPAQSDALSGAIAVDRRVVAGE